MKKIISQALLVCLISFVVAITFNQFSASPLPILKTYIPSIAQELGNIRDSQGTLISDYIQEMDIELLKVLLKNRETILIDARHEPDFQQNHIPLAINLPVTRFDDEYRKKRGLFAEKQIVVCYCSSKDCSDARLLAVKLYLQGHTDVFVLIGGFEEWVAGGNPVSGNGPG